MGRKRPSFTTRYVLLVGILLLIANSVLGVVVLMQSSEAMAALVDNNMLDLVKSASASLDGDVLRDLTEDDVDGPEFRDIEKKLLVFQNSTDIQFIYAVKREDDDRYVFTVDPDPVDPGAFGEEIVTTPALVMASEGTPTVDSNPAEDRWGNYYSAYSPVFDSSGKVAGVVGVDFDTEWYDAQIRQYTVSIAAITAASVFLAGAVVVYITRGVRSKFESINVGITELSDGVDMLMSEIMSNSDYEASIAQANQQKARVTDDVSDELEVLDDKVRILQNEMGLYLDYLRRRAYIDALTNVGNSISYHETVDAIDESIANGETNFWVIVFDINGLKELNDNFGHECGDYYIKGAAQSLEKSFGREHVFRIGGDEFAVIGDEPGADCLKNGLDTMMSSVEEFNASSAYDAVLSVSQGAACFVPGQDESFSDVFARADKIMYENKRAYYRESGADGRGPRGA